MNTFTDKPGYAFKPGAPKEVADYLARKELKPSFSWQDVEPQEHAAHFAVAKAMQVDVLTTIKEELQKALDEGVPFKQFQKELEPRLRKLGWWGAREMRDPQTGELRRVTLGSPRRLKTIYRANIRSARAAGQWDRINRTKKTMPYLVYLIGPSENHRPHHEAKNGLVLPVDDPFWLQWMPPNGWGCKCRVRQIGQREAEEIGIGESPDIPTRNVTNNRTGEVRKVPVGIDPGWDTNAGLHRQKSMQDFLAGKLDEVDPAIARVAARDLASSWRVQRIHDGSAHGAVPVAIIKDELKRELELKTGVVHFNSEVAAKLRADRPEATPGQIPLLASVLDEGTIVQRPGPNSLSFLHQVDGVSWLAAIRITDDRREIYLTDFHRPERAFAEQLLKSAAPRN